jgi:hypothetical protein
LTGSLKSTVYCVPGVTSLPGAGLIATCCGGVRSMMTVTAALSRVTPARVARATSVCLPSDSGARFQGVR